MVTIIIGAISVDLMIIILVVMVCSILAHVRAPRISNNLSYIVRVTFAFNGVKQRTVSMLAGLGVTSSYNAISNRYGEQADKGKVLFHLRIYSPYYLNYTTRG